MSCSLVDEAIVLRCMGSLCFAAGLQGKVCVTKHTSIFLMEKGYRTGIVRVFMYRHNGLPVWVLSINLLQYFSFVHKILVYDLLPSKYVAHL